MNFQAILTRMNSFVIYSGYFYSASPSPLLLRGAPKHRTDTVSEFHAKASHATEIEGPAQGPYEAATAGFKPTSLWTNGI